MLNQKNTNTYTFADFGTPVRARYETLARVSELYVVDVQDLFETYLAAFPEGTNPIFRTRTEHDCSCCKNFIRNLGRVVAIIDGKLETVWDVPDLPEPYATVARILAATVRQAPIISVFRTKERQYGTEYNYDNEITGKRWDHFSGKVDAKHFSAEPDTVRGRLNENAAMLKRACTELSLSAVDTVLDLIEGNALYRGEEHKGAVVNFRELLVGFNNSPDRNLYAWANLASPGVRFRNSAIGSLVTDLSDGKDLDAAVRMFESKVAPTNYKRPTAVITPKMIDAAMQTIDQLGISDALYRRYAQLNDISINNVLFVDRSARPQMKDDLRGSLMKEVKLAARTPARVDRISAQGFLDNVLPTATSLAVMLENRHLGNFVSLTTSDDPTRLFKWDNPFAWSYDGDVTDSVKERVKKAGGNVTAPFRVSLSWFNRDDLDLHMHEPNGNEIYFASKRGTYGVLDVDMNISGETREAVENIVFSRFPDGQYIVEVHNYTRRESIDVGFEIELEFKGEVQNFSYPKGVSNNETVSVMTVTVVKGAITDLKLNPALIGGSKPTDKWGVRTGAAVPVSTFLLSPNHWDGQGVGNRHFFFMLEGCKNPGSARGIYNEFLRPEFEQHRKVLEVLGAKTKCPPSDDQLSGVGFSSTRGDDVVIQVNNHNYHVQF